MDDDGEWGNDTWGTYGRDGGTVMDMELTFESALRRMSSKSEMSVQACVDGGENHTCIRNEQ